MNIECGEVRCIAGESQGMHPPAFLDLARETFADPDADEDSTIERLYF